MKVLVRVKDAGGTPHQVTEARKRWVDGLSEAQYADLLDALRSIQEKKGARVESILLNGIPCIDVTFQHVTPGLQRLVEVTIELVTSLPPRHS